MAHSYDTGLSAPIRTLLRSGVVTLLAGLKISSGGYLRAVVPFGAVVRSYTDLDGIDKLKAALSGQTPAIAIAMGDCSSKPAGTGGFHFMEEHELLVYHANNSQRDLVDGRQAIDVAGIAADTSDPGIDVAMAHTKELIIGQRCGVDHPAVKQIRPDREEELATDKDLTIWLQTYRITTALSINKDRSVTQMLTSIRFRTTQETGEVNLPADAIKETTIDVNIDDLPT